MNFCKVAALAGLNTCDNQPAVSLVESAFIEHLGQYGVSYGTKEEYEFRFDIFKRKHAKNEEINASQDSFTVGHNEFSTWTDAEYRRLLGYNGPQVLPEDLEITELEASNETGIDWRTKGAINEVRTQGNCGSGWAMSSTAAMEGHFKIQYGELLSLSVQQLLDCDFEDNGCQGGFQYKALYHLIRQYLQLESEYPYEGKQVTCRYWQQGTAGVYHVNNIRPFSSEALIAAIEKGPVAITVQADSDVFQRYQSGILDSEDCGIVIDHNITAVGYGEQNGVQYYIAMNSWGTGWGDSGYIKIKATKNDEGICGIQQISSWPQVKKP